MSLSDLASLGSFVSGFAVLVSLIYLALQVRQAEKNQRALIQMARASRAADHLDRVSDPGAVDAYSKGLSGDLNCTNRELSQFYFLFRSSFFGMEDAFFQHSQKLLDDGAFQSTIGTMKMMFSTPGARVMWKRQREMHDPNFRTFVDGIMNEAKVARAETEEDGLARWRTEIATELAEA